MMLNTFNTTGKSLKNVELLVNIKVSIKSDVFSVYLKNMSSNYLTSRSEMSRLTI